MRRRFLTLAATSLLLLGVSACGEDGGSPDAGPSETVTGAAIPGLEVTGSFAEEPKVSVDALETDKVESQVVIAGDGNPVVAGQQALLHLFLANGETGEKAAATYDQGAPVALQMDESQLFKPVLDQLIGKPQGSRIAIAAPVKDIYGAQGASQLDLKPDDSVVFVVDIMSVPPKDVVDGPSGAEQKVPDGLPQATTEGGEVTGFNWSGTPKQAPKKLQVIPLVEGDGPPARDDSLVTFDYFGEVWNGKKPFDESYSKEPVTFALGMGNLIKAWDEGLVGVKRGSRVMVVAPPDIAYGDQARPGIPAGSTLVFVVDILGVDG